MCTKQELQRLTVGSSIKIKYYEMKSPFLSK